MRGAYTYQKGRGDDIYSSDGSRNNFSSGLTLGASVNAPLSKPKGDKKGTFISIDYAYRMTAILGGIHTVGLSLSL